MVATRPRHEIYRRCIAVYPRDFRREYGEDLVQHFDELIADRGRRQAVLCTTLDLLVTVPAYRLERIMSQQQRATSVMVVLSLLVAAGVAGLLTDVYPAFLPFGLAAVLAVSQRSALAKALRTPIAGLRRRRLRISAVLAVVSVVSVAFYVMTIGDTWTTRDSVVVGIGTLAMVGAPLFLLAGLLTPKADYRPQGHAL